MRTLKFLKINGQIRFLLPSIKCVGDSSRLPTTAEHAVIKSNHRSQFRQHRRKLGLAAELLVDGSEKHLSVELWILEFVCYRVLTGPGKPGKSWNFIAAFSRTGKSWSWKRPLLLESSRNLFNSTKKVWSVRKAVRRTDFIHYHDKTLLNY